MTRRQAQATATPPRPALGGFLTDDVAIAACVLWSAGHFDTAQIASLLHVAEDAVWRTLHIAKNGARERTFR